MCEVFSEKAEERNPIFCRPLQSFRSFVCSFPLVYSSIFVPADFPCGCNNAHSLWMPEDTVCMQCKEKKGKKGKGKTPSLIPRYFKQRVEKGERERKKGGYENRISLHVDVRCSRRFLGQVNISLRLERHPRSNCCCSY
jgi:hypothetical protein